MALCFGHPIIAKKPHAERGFRQQALPCVPPGSDAPHPPKRALQTLARPRPRPNCSRVLCEPGLTAPQRSPRPVRGWCTAHYARGLGPEGARRAPSPRRQPERRVRTHPHSGRPAAAVTPRRGPLRSGLQWVRIDTQRVRPARWVRAVLRKAVGRPSVRRDPSHQRTRHGFAVRPANGVSNRAAGRAQFNPPPRDTRTPPDISPPAIDGRVYRR